MPKTSISHPLQIATIDVPGKPGRIGVTFCPGKIQPDAENGPWKRDLGLDLDHIAAWGANVVITLIEPHELVELRVPTLGAEVQSRHMRWLHLPIADYSIPTKKFELAWKTVAPSLQEALDAGQNILVHCKGGLGRAGTIAARLLVEAGVPARDSIALVRARRGPNAIETPEQELYVKNLSTRDDAAMHRRPLV